MQGKKQRLFERWKNNMFMERVRYAFYAWSVVWRPLSCMASVAGLLAGIATLFSEWWKEVPVYWVCALLLVSFLGNMIYHISVRWIRVKVYIPPNRREARDYEGKVTMSMLDILAPFEKKDDVYYDIALAYNCNHLVGGIEVNGELNLMGQFLCKYFPADGAKVKNRFAQFDMELFVQCLQNEATRAFCLKGEHGRFELSEIEAEYFKNRAVDVRSIKDKLIVPETLFAWRTGTVVALKLPEGADREYAYLMCSTKYEKNLSEAISDETELCLCLDCLWKVVHCMHPIDKISRQVAVPFLNKGYSRMRKGIAFGVLWNILHSYKMETQNKSSLERCMVDIHMPREVLLSNNFRMDEVLRFLKFALMG